MPSRTNFSEILTSIMNETKISLTELARRTGVASQSIVTLRNKSNPSLYVALRYLNELDYDVVIVKRGACLPSDSYICQQTEHKIVPDLHESTKQDFAELVAAYLDSSSFSKDECDEDAIVDELFRDYLSVDSISLERLTDLLIKHSK